MLDCCSGARPIENPRSGDVVTKALSPSIQTPVTIRQMGPLQEKRGLMALRQAYRIQFGLVSSHLTLRRSVAC